MTSVTCFNRILVESQCKEVLLPLAEKKGDEQNKSQEPCSRTQGKTHTRRKTRIFTVIP